MSKPDAKAPGITLVGGGAPSPQALARAVSRAPRLIAVDGGADAALAMGYMPDLATGDFDSISDAARDTLGEARLHHTPDQEQTDFDKALALVDAPFVLAVGFTGARLDHTLAAMSTLLRAPSRRVILDTGDDLCLLCPPRLRLALARGTRVSLYPMAPMRCRSSGLHWPTTPLHFAPNGRIGTSNAATGAPVVLEPDGPSMLLLLPVTELDGLLSALEHAPLWPDAVPAR